MRNLMLGLMLVVGCAATTQTGTRTTAPKLESDLPDPEAAPSPQWIWGPQEAKEGEERYFRVVFDPKIAKPPVAWLWAVGDDEITVYVNGKQVFRHKGYGDAALEDIAARLVAGENVISVRVRNEKGPAALSVMLEIPRKDGKPFRLVSDESWLSSSKNPQGWRGKNFKDESFVKSRVLFPFGGGPWGKPKAPIPGQATPVENLTLLPGFKAELLYSVPKGNEGSWVCMTPDPKGRLYVSDQSGALYRVTPPPIGTTTELTVEKVDLEIGSAQGLLWAFDSLYVVVNGSGETYNSGLYRLRDTDGNDKLDKIEPLKKFLDRNRVGPAGGEHGPHAVVLGPDKKLYIVAGNFTSLPDGLAATSPAANWSEDLLLPRMTDGKGHDPTIYVPASWVSRTDENGKTWEVFATGMRNAYDIAFAPDGELFTFDSDMEWDIGAPWYRPIRICHIVSGAEFGWRNGSAKWPSYYPDGVPPVVDIGPGSPTGVTFGTGARFPAKYQAAFFAADWAYGKLFAVHTKPDGASYKADFEPFIVGKPFGITDVVINPTDGAMYITIGGRGTQSGLYRVTYVGTEVPTPRNIAENVEAKKARGLRHKLESFHGHRDSTAVEIAWPHLGSDDRFIRYAARVAIEAQDPATWTDKALTEKNATAAINALVALCRVGNSSLQPRILGALNELDLAKLSHTQLLEALRAYELCFIRMGRPMDPAAAPSVASRFDKLYPSDNDDVNHELCQLLVYLRSPEVITKSLALLDKATTQEEQLFYAFNLRNIREGWKPEQRKAYFEWLNRAQQKYTGGASYKLFLTNVREESIKTLGDNEKTALATLLKSPMEIAYDPTTRDTKERKFVKAWTMADLTPKLAKLKSGRSFENGKAAFNATSCIKCHRFNNEGGASGPDISGVGNRFQPADLLETIVLPSKVISDQYQATEIVTKKKEVFVGTIHEENDERVVIRPSPLATATETVLKKDIADRHPSKLSIMPQSLIDVLSEDDVLDLLAYLRSAGDPNDPAFKPTSSAAE